jgi:hypothetical protein
MRSTRVGEVQMSMRCALVVSLVSFVVFAAEARAEVNCGSVRGRWNVPGGALVTSRSDSIIGRALAGLETRSHSMVAYESSGAHAALDPDYLSDNVQGWPNVCSNGPVNPNALRYGYPGYQIINLPAIYAYYWLSEDGLQAITQQYPPADRRRSMAFHTAQGLVRPTYYENRPIIYRADDMKQIGGGYTLPLIPGRDSNNNLVYYYQRYVLDQYFNIAGRDEGLVPGHKGVVCSTLIAWGFNNMSRVWPSPIGAPGYDPNGFNITPYQYSTAQTQAMGNKVKNGVENSCGAATGWFKDVYSRIGCPFDGMCDDLGRQVRNCMVSSGGCGTDDDATWNWVVSSGMRARTVSPSRLGGFDMHAPGPGPRPPEEEFRGPWYDSAAVSITWSGSGDTYGCWSDGTFDP